LVAGGLGDVARLFVPEARLRKTPGRLRDEGEVEEHLALTFFRAEGAGERERFVQGALRLVGFADELIDRAERGEGNRLAEGVAGADAQLQRVLEVRARALDFAEVLVASAGAVEAAALAARIAVGAVQPRRVEEGLECFA